MNVGRAVGAALSGDEPPDTVWRQYCEAVGSLGELPQLIAGRHLKVDARSDGDLAAQRKNLDEQLQQSQQWRMLAGRALSNAQARLVAAKVLIPDVAAPSSSAASPWPDSTPAELVDRLNQAVADVDSDVVVVRTARRRAVDESARDEAGRLAAARRRRHLRLISAVGALVMVLLLAAWLI